MKKTTTEDIKGFLASVGAILFVAVFVFAMSSCTSNNSKATDTVQSEVAQSEVSQSGGQIEGCPVEFTQVNDLRPNNEVSTRLPAALENATQKAGGELDKNGIAEALLEVQGSDAQVLALMAKYAGLYDGDPDNWQELTTEDKSCLNEKGQSLYYMLKGAYSAESTTLELKDEPASCGTLYNSGIADDKFVINRNVGVCNGNKRLIEITFANGSKMYIFERCHNFLFTSKPSDVPTGKTDEPDKPNGPDKPTPPPTTEEQKSSNPYDWEHPNHNGSAPDGGNAETSSSSVQTQQPSNNNREGGTTSNSGQVPGSAGGGTAPNANTGTSDSGGSKGPTPPETQTGGNGANGQNGTGDSAGTGDSGNGNNTGTIDPSDID